MSLLYLAGRQIYSLCFQHGAELVKYIHSLKSHQTPEKVFLPPRTQKLLVY